MLEKHQQILLKTLGSITLTEHAIGLRKKVGKIPTISGKAEEKITRAIRSYETDQWLSEMPSVFRVAAPVLFAPQKDGKLRLLIDYRKPIQASVEYSYRLSRIDEYFESLGFSKIFTTLFTYSIYWKVPNRPEDKQKSEFVCHTSTNQPNPIRAYKSTCYVSTLAGPHPHQVQMEGLSHLLGRPHHLLHDSSRTFLAGGKHYNLPRSSGRYLKNKVVPLLQ